MESSACVTYLNRGRSLTRIKGWSVGEDTPCVSCQLKSIRNAYAKRCSAGFRNVWNLAASQGQRLADKDLVVRRGVHYTAERLWLRSP